MQRASSWATAWPPITLATLAALARRVGAVRLLDGDVEEATIADVLEEIGSLPAHVVVVNTGFPSIDRDMAVAEAIKKAFPRVKLVGVGVYFSLLGGEALVNYPFLDFALVGEPEETFTELLGALERGEDGSGDIKGLAFRGDGAVRVNPPRPVIDDLDVLPFPARDLLKNHRYRLPHNDRPFTLINTARGCPYACTYCIVRPYFGSKVRRHSLDYVLREIEHCVRDHKITDFLIWEEVFTLDKRYVLALCRAVRERRLPIRWAATTRVGAVDEEMLVAMRQAGCYLLGFGIESASQDILNRARKQQTVEDARRAVALCRKVGIKSMGHCIFGLPGETRGTALKTIEFMTRVGLDYMQAYCAVPYPGTELGDLARRRGWIRATAWSQYDFGGDSIMDTEALRCDEVTAFRRLAFRRFYLRPWYLMANLLRSLSPRQWLRLSTFRDWMRLVARKKGRPA